MNVLHLVSVIIALVVSCNMTGSALASQDENATYQMTVSSRYAVRLSGATLCIVKGARNLLPDRTDIQPQSRVYFPASRFAGDGCR